MGPPQTANESEPLPVAYPAVFTVASAQYEPLAFVLNAKPNLPFESVLPDALATIRPEQVPDATSSVAPAPAIGAPVPASVAVDVSGTW